jgi:hypothetical protein
MNHDGLAHIWLTASEEYIVHYSYSVRDRVKLLPVCVDVGLSPADLRPSQGASLCPPP